MASGVTAPLERQFGQLPGLKQMTSISSSGSSIVTLQFDLALSIDVAEQQVQAAINAAATFLPRDLPNPPVYSKVNPADAPVPTAASPAGLPRPRAGSPSPRRGWRAARWLSAAPPRPARAAAAPRCGAARRAFPAPPPGGAAAPPARALPRLPPASPPPTAARSAPAPPRDRRGGA